MLTQLSAMTLPTPGSLIGGTAPRLTSGVVTRLKEQLEQAEADLEANRHVNRDSQLAAEISRRAIAKHRERLLSFSSLEPGLVLTSVPSVGHPVWDTQRLIRKYSS
ncbi:hypothetical protein WJX79_009423 [Trebouxia sp. C0005]